MKLQLHPTKPYVIAELGTSCDGSVGNMIELARHCVAAGASAIKMQDHELQYVEKTAQHPPWFQGAHFESREDYLRRQALRAPNPHTDCDVFTVPDALQELREHGPQCPIIVSAFSEQRVRTTQNLPDAWKIASGQVTNHELIRACVATGLPLILSSGMTTTAERDAALAIVPAEQLWAVFDCTSEYPCPPERVSIAAPFTGCTCYGPSSWLKPGSYDEGAKDAPTHGFSDHTDPDSAAAAIVALTRGARVFERHVTFDRRMYGSDAKHACTLEQFEHYCRELGFASRIPDRDIRDENAERLSETRKVFLHGHG